eukprot:5482626-Prymnesium_polylepis.1
MHHNTLLTKTASCSLLSNPTWRSNDNFELAVLAAQSRHRTPMRRSRSAGEMLAAENLIAPPEEDEEDEEDEDEDEDEEDEDEEKDDDDDDDRPSLDTRKSLLELQAEEKEREEQRAKERRASSLEQRTQILEEAREKREEAKRASLEQRRKSSGPGRKGALAPRCRFSQFNEIREETTPESSF